MADDQVGNDGAGIDESGAAAEPSLGLTPKHRDATSYRTSAEEPAILREQHR